MSKSWDRKWSDEIPQQEGTRKSYQNKKEHDRKAAKAKRDQKRHMRDA